jgi:ABC-type nickel/cobalt efflux system permease component RcnA
MKKLMTLMLGLSLVLGSTALFAKDAKDTTKKEKPAKKAKKKKTTDTK